MMKLVQSIEVITNVRLKRVGLLRWEMQQDKHISRLYRCDICGSLVATHDSAILGECECTPCITCGKPKRDKHHTSVLAMPMSTWNMSTWNMQYLMSTPAPPEKKPAKTHYYAPERRNRTNPTGG